MNQVTLKLIPRIDYGRIMDKDHRGKAKLYKKAPPKLFDYELIR